MSRTCLVSFVNGQRIQTIDLNHCIQTALRACIGGSSQTLSPTFLTPGEYTTHDLHVIKLDYPPPSSFVYAMRLACDMPENDTLINTIALEILIELATTSSTESVTIRFD